MKAKRSSRFVLNLLGVGTAVSLLGDATLYTVLPHPDISAQLGITLSMVGLLMGANRAIRLIFNGPVGLLYDHMPRRTLLIAGLSLGAGSSLFYAVANGFWSLLVGRVTWGLAWSLLWVGGNSVVLDVSTEENRGRNSGIYQRWFFIGVATASLAGAMLTGLYTALSNVTSIGSAPLAGFVSDRFGWRWPVIGVALLLSGVGLWFMSGEIHILALIGAFLVPIAGSSAETLIPAIAGDRVPENLRSRALGLINIAGDLGATIGPFAALGVLNLGWFALDGIYRIGAALFGVVALFTLSPLIARQSRNMIH